MSDDSISSFSSSFSLDNEINDFFESLQLNVKFDNETVFSDNANIFNHIYPIKYDKAFNSNQLMKRCFRTSYELDVGLTLNPNIYDKLASCNNSMENVYKVITSKSLAVNTNNSLLSKVDYKRYKNAFINGCYSTIYMGARYQFINYTKLQNWINMFHAFHFESNLNKMICGFILHLLYIRILPHSSDNARMARYLFLENKLLSENTFVPLSPMLNESIEAVTNILEEIYKWLFTTVDYTKATEEDYYPLTGSNQCFHITNNVLSKIIYLIYITRLFNHCCRAKGKFSSTLKSNLDYEYMFCRCRGSFKIRQTTDMYVSEYRTNLLFKFMGWLNKNFFDYSSHYDIIKRLIGIQ